jgi:hypothetical protein
LIKTDQMRRSIIKGGTTSSNASTRREQLAQKGARCWCELTGNFFDLGDINSLISCEHDLGKRKTNDLRHRVVGSDRYFAVTGPGASAPEPLDLAVAAIEPVLWDEYWRKSEAVPEDRLAVMHRAAPNELRRGKLAIPL